MITMHVSAVCRVRDGFTGRAIEASGLVCALDGAPFRPVGKPGGYLVLVNLPGGTHRLSLRCQGYQEEWVEIRSGRGTQELDVTMKPGEGYPFRQEVTLLTLTILEGGEPAVLITGMPVWSVWLTDLTGDGLPELGATLCPVPLRLVLRGHRFVCGCLGACLRALRLGEGAFLRRRDVPVGGNVLA